MGNYSFFLGCPSAEAASRDDRSEKYWHQDFLPANQGGWGPSLSAKYAVPMLWVACFSREDEILVARTLTMTEDQARAARSAGVDPGPHDMSFMGLWVSTETARTRIAARKRGILEAIPEPLRSAYGDLIDAWADHLHALYAQGVFLDGDDVFGMSGNDESAEALRALLDALARMESGEASLLSGDIELLSPLPKFQFLTPEETPSDAASGWRAQFAGSALLESAVWPPELTADEIAFAASLPRMSWQDRLKTQNPPPQKPWWKFW